MFRGKKAFTLTELLIALAIVGALAALAIPSLVEDINRKLLISQLKNTVVMVQVQISQLRMNVQRQKNVGEMKMNTNVFLIWIQKQEAVVQPKC